MVDKRLRMIFEGQDNISSKITGINQALELLKKVAEGVKKAWEFAEEGAQLARIETVFTNLAGSINAVSSALEDELKRTLGGVMTEMEGMELASELMGLGLAKNKDEVVRLTNIAGQMGMDMSQLVLTLTNQTTRRFDTLGLSVDGFNEKVKALEEQGYATDEAFKLAFMEQAEQQIETVGGYAETTAGQFEIFTNNLEDMVDAIKKWAADAVDPMIRKMNEAQSVTDALHDAMVYGVMDEIEGNQALQNIARGVDGVTESYLWLVPAMEDYLAQVNSGNPELEKQIGLQDAAVRSLELLADRSWMAADAYKALADNIYDVSKAQVKQIAMEHGLGSEVFQMAYARYLHNTKVSDELDALLFPREKSATRGVSRSKNKELAKDIAQELGEVIKSENVRDAQMLEDIRRMLRGLPMVIRDVSERTTL